MQSKIKVGVIGCGYWGPNLIRNFSQSSLSEVKIIADRKPGRIEFIKDKYPSVCTTSDYQDILRDDEICAVCIATPVKTHKEIAADCLQNGKHVFIEKPMTYTIAEAYSLLEMAEKNDRMITVGHIFQHNPAVQFLHDYFHNNHLEKLYYITSSRMNMGAGWYDVDVTYDLATHDIYIINSLKGKLPVEVSAIGRAFTQSLVDSAIILLYYDDDTIAKIEVSWLTPYKMRLMNIFWQDGSCVYDENNPEHKITLYGKGVDSRLNANSSDKGTMSYGIGDIHYPELPLYEPLAREVDNFNQAILGTQKLLVDEMAGLSTVRVLETIAISMQNDGKRISLI